MAIGTAAAIGLGVAGVGSFLSSKSQSKAAGQAADASVQASRENAALARDIYGQNQQALSPFMNRGNAAGDQINALLGLGGATQTTQAASGVPGASVWDQYLQQNPDVMRGWRETGQAFKTPQEYAQFHYSTYGRNEGRKLPSQQAPATPAAANENATKAAQNAFDIFKNSTGYQSRLAEGYEGLNSGLASSGVLQSGAAQKEAIRYGQNFASNEFGNYLNALGNQQGVGLSGASALAGVGQNYANTMAANNNQAASAVGNAALIKGQNNPFGNALGIIGGGFLGGL